jgi:hypothetical protein
MQKLTIASFKGTRQGVAGVFSIAVRWWLGGPYSHTELIFSDGVSGSSSGPDGGVALRVIQYDPTQWDFLTIDGDEKAARKWFEDHQGQPFDFLGLLGFVWTRGLQSRRKWFCSEAVAASLGFDEPHRFDPCSLPAFLKRRDAE